MNQVNEGLLEEEKTDDAGVLESEQKELNEDDEGYHQMDPNYPEDEFPNHLGCFGILQTEFKSTKSWPLKPDKPFYWSVTKNRKDTSCIASFLRFVESQTEKEFTEKSDMLKVSGAWSPPHRVNLDAKSRELANIPLDATKFAWFYPAEEIPIDVLSLNPNAKVVEKWKNDPSVMSLIIGGFSYFNDANQLLLENTLTPNAESGLQFGKPQKWKHEFAGKLIEQERFHKITFSHMINRGALYFGWIFPFEELFDSEGNSWVVSKYGAFGYLYHDPKASRSTKWAYDRYFECVPSDINDTQGDGNPSAETK
eukprot:93430_1